MFLCFLYILSKSHQSWSACQHNIYVRSKILIITFFYFPPLYGDFCPGPQAPEHR